MRLTYVNRAALRASYGCIHAINLKGAVMKKTWAQLLVHMDATPQAVVRLDVACRLAATTGAAVTALYGVIPSLLQVPLAAEAGADAIAALQEIDAQRRTDALAAFRRSQLAAAAKAGWADAGMEPVIPAVAQQALYADLLVLGQHDTAALQGGVPGDLVESVMAASGKPALVIPYTGSVAAAIETVAIAWKPTREAARAVTAAMPLLQRARNVHVLAWQGEGGPAVGGSKLDLAGYLALHGVQATWHREGGEPGELGDLLLSRACDLDAGLLVMGCYGHSRAREWVLGGTSRTVLRSMTLPVLMAH